MIRLCLQDFCGLQSTFQRFSEMFKRHFLGWHAAQQVSTSVSTRDVQWSARFHPSGETSLPTAWCHTLEDTIFKTHTFPVIVSVKTSSIVIYIYIYIYICVTILKAIKERSCLRHYATSRKVAHKVKSGKFSCLSWHLESYIQFPWCFENWGRPTTSRCSDGLTPCSRRPGHSLHPSTKNVGMQRCLSRSVDSISSTPVSIIQQVQLGFCQLTIFYLLSE
jgi:hypothetical protein